jgi:hypothetical protein
MPITLPFLMVMVRQLLTMLCPSLFLQVKSHPGIMTQLLLRQTAMLIVRNHHHQQQLPPEVANTIISQTSAATTNNASSSETILSIMPRTLPTTRTAGGQIITRLG